MRRAQRGSILILVLVVVASIILGMTHLMRSFSYANQIVFARQQYQQKLYDAEGLLNFGIKQCSAQFAHLTKMQQQGSLRIKDWPCADGKGNEGLININANKESIFIHAILQRNDKAIVAISCRLGQRDDTFTISDWTIETT